ncbi:MAG: hypothetical protein KBG02_01165 [Haliscomenobacter sp.]|nr:hypothetical protein [Haliscomenobacter sp.]MBP9075438.1 hypothetical protein [Haliscomenobacter sp.]MBP9873113.1 hypothetical protein [Haliscomenobacter sp.]
MKLLFSLLLIYVVYRFFFTRPLLSRPGGGDMNQRSGRPPQQNNIRSKDEEDYVDYEEVD